MRQAIILFLVGCIALTGSCGGQSDREELETVEVEDHPEQTDQEPQLSDEEIYNDSLNSILCNTIMEDITINELMHRHMFGHYTLDFMDLIELDRRTGGSRCPGCNEEYILEISRDGNEFTITCPGGHGQHSCDYGDH